ncbi:hypothetical protein D3C80_2007750 [compost metagenome]
MRTEYNVIKFVQELVAIQKCESFLALHARIILEVLDPSIGQGKAAVIVSAE